VVLGLTFLAIALTFALPFELVPQGQVSETSANMSPEVANVYACVAWAGWAHFLFAFRGQGSALLRLRASVGSGRLLAFAACVALALVALSMVRWVSGTALFGAVVWVYFIDHFLKAEQTFEGQDPLKTSSLRRWLSSYQALLSFGWLTVVLTNIGGVNTYPWVLWLVSLLLALLILFCGGWSKLARGDSRNALLSLFFVAEALVWGTFSHYGGPMFLTGVYVFHIAAGSYVHYLGSYFFANARSKSKDVVLSPPIIVAVNVAIVVLGYFVVRTDSLQWLSKVLGTQWFTLWVALHLVSSDLYPYFKVPRVRATGT
jgi:hypothetical protein